METVRIILTTVEAAACLAVSVVAVNVLLKKDVPCDSCSYLQIKRRWSDMRSSGKTRYVCDKKYGFDTPPLYCGSYCKREEGGEDE